MGFQNDCPPKPVLQISELAELPLEINSKTNMKLQTKNVPPYLSYMFLKSFNAVIPNDKP